MLSFLQKLLSNIKLKTNRNTFFPRLEEDIKRFNRFIETSGLYPEIKIIDSNKPETFVNGKKYFYFVLLII